MLHLNLKDDCEYLNSSSRRAGDHNFVDPDVVVGESSEQQISALVPGQGGAPNWFLHLLLVGVQGGGSNVHNDLLAGQVPHLDALLGSDDQPQLGLGEQDAVDWAVHLHLV